MGWGFLEDRFRIYVVVVVVLMPAPEILLGTRRC